MISIAIVDDHEIIRNGLKQLLAGSNDIYVKETFADGADLLDAYANNFRVDVILLDIKMKNVGGIETLRQMQHLYPNSCIVILTLYYNASTIEQVLKLGAMGILVKDASIQEIYNAIVSAQQGTLLKSKPLEMNAQLSLFTTKQLAIIDLFIQGCNSTEVAEKMFLSLGTVKNYTSQIYEKLGVKHRTEALSKLRSMGYY